MDQTVGGLLTLTLAFIMKKGTVSAFKDGGSRNGEFSGGGGRGGEQVLLRADVSTCLEVVKPPGDGLWGWDVLT